VVAVGGDGAERVERMDWARFWSPPPRSLTMNGSHARPVSLRAVWVRSGSFAEPASLPSRPSTGHEQRRDRQAVVLPGGAGRQRLSDAGRTVAPGSARGHDQRVVGDAFVAVVVWVVRGWSTGQVRTPGRRSKVFPAASRVIGRANLSRPAWMRAKVLSARGLARSPMRCPGMDQSIATAAGSTDGLDDLVPARRVRAAVDVLLPVAAHVAAGRLEDLHGAHPLAVRAPGARPQPLVPVRGPAEALVPVRHVQAVAGLRRLVHAARVGVHGVQGDRAARGSRACGSPRASGPTGPRRGRRRRSRRRRP
jgi:hypothetical protein